ncbi:uncharacterized protein LOC143257409 [Tachypleus tridentatus]|uniref:uncharacterized protein LOC143257409 n=1 Tax=Tachypleus tridentatus TaxID=6853 RepID=UPI003FCF7315
MMLKLQCLGCLLTLVLFSIVSSLNCYRCGTYNTEGAGSVAPCYEFNETHLKSCDPTENYCMKYSNKGIIVRQCISDCQPQEGQTVVQCCQQDGCNGSQPVTLTISTVATTIACTMLLSILH